MPTKTPVPPSSSSSKGGKTKPASAPASPASARAVAADYNKALRMTSSGVGGSSKIYSVADTWAAHYKPRDETKVFVNAVGLPRDVQGCPFRVPGREDHSLSDDPATKHSGADVHIAGNPGIEDNLLLGLPKHPVSRDGTPYWHRGWKHPQTIGSRAGSPDPQSACAYFNDSVQREHSTVPILSVAIVPSAAGYDYDDETDTTRTLMMELMQGAKDMDAAYDKKLHEEIRRKQQAVEYQRSLIYKKAAAAKRAAAGDAAVDEQHKDGDKKEENDDDDDDDGQHHDEKKKAEGPQYARDIATPSFVAVTAIELLGDTTEGRTHRTRNVFSERYTKLPPCTWQLKQVCRHDRIVAKNDAAARIQLWFRRCKVVAAQRQTRRDIKTARETRARQLILIRSAKIKLRHAVHLYVQRFTGLRRRTMAVRVVRAMRRGCRTSINAAKDLLVQLRRAKADEAESEAVRCKENFAAIQIQRIWRGVRLRFVARVMLYVYSLARARFDEEFFEATLKSWLFHFSFRRVRRSAATQIQRCWRRFILRRDVNMSRFLSVVELPCPPSATARRVRIEERARELQMEKLVALEDEISGSHPDSPLRRIAAEERRKAVSSSSASQPKRSESPSYHRRRPLSLDEISRRLGESPPPVPTKFAEDYYNKTGAKSLGFDFLNPTMAGKM